MSKTLLEKAKDTKPKIKKLGKATNEHFELAKAWANGDITTYQVAKAIGVDLQGGNVLYRLASWIRSGVEEGKIKIK